MLHRYSVLYSLASPCNAKHNKHAACYRSAVRDLKSFLLNCSNNDCTSCSLTQQNAETTSPVFGPDSLSLQPELPFRSSSKCIFCFSTFISQNMYSIADLSSVRFSQLMCELFICTTSGNNELIGEQNPYKHKVEIKLKGDIKV